MKLRTSLRSSLSAWALMPIAALAQLPSAEDVRQLRIRWSEPVEPYRVVGNTWYVGPGGLTVLAVRTRDGVILLDSALPESVPRVLENLASLGIDPSDVRLLLSSHAHFDHAGGFAELQAGTDAELVATRESAELLAAGGLGDLHYRDSMPFPAVTADRLIEDGGTVSLGDYRLTAWRTPGHTPGSTTWTWQERVDGRVIDVVYADSLTAPGYQLVGNARYPQIVTDFTSSIATIAQLPCDVLITPHPQAAGLEARRERRSAPDAPLMSPGGCVRYAERAREAIGRQVDAQSVATSSGAADALEIAR